MFVSFAETLRAHEAGLLAWYRCLTAPLDGTHNKIKTLQQQAYGYRDTASAGDKAIGTRLSGRIALVTCRRARLPAVGAGRRESSTPEREVDATQREAAQR